MSISIYQSPAIVHGAYNDLIHTCYSNQAVNSVFRYDFELMLAAFTFDHIIINPSSNYYGMLNIKRLLATQFTRDNTDYLPAIVAWTQKARSILNYNLKVSEYGIGSDVSYFSVHYALNSVNPFTQQGMLYKNYTYSDYIINDAKPKKFLQTWEGIRKARLTDIGTLSLLNGNFGGGYYAKIKRFELSVYYQTAHDPTIKVRKFYVNNPDYNYTPAGLLTSDVKKMRLDIPCYPGNLDAIGTITCYWYNGAITPGLWIGAIFMDGDLYYEITVVGDSGDNVTAEVIRFDLLDGCWDSVNEIMRYYKYGVMTTPNRYVGCQIAFRNSLGSYEYFPFELVTQESIKVKKDTFDKNKFLWAGSYYSEDLNNGGLKVINIETQELIIVNSDYFTVETSNNLKELFISNEVFIIINGSSYPVILQDTDYYILSKEWARMGQLTLHFIKSITPNPVL